MWVIARIMECLLSLIPAEQVDDIRQPDNAAPSLHLRYKGFVTTTSGSAPRSGIGIHPYGFCHLSFPFTSRTRFSRSILEPVLSSCRLYTDCHRVRKQVSSRLIPEWLHDPGFDSSLGLTMRHRTVCFRSSSQHVPDIFMMPFPQSLTTTSFERSRTGRFDFCSCKPISGGLLPSLVQHRKLTPAFVTH